MTRRRDETVPPAAEQPAPVDELSWPDPIGDRRWVDESGVLWRLRGGGVDAALRRIDHLLRLPEVRVLHFSGTGSPADIEMPQRDAYWPRVCAMTARRRRATASRSSGTPRIARSWSFWNPADASAARHPVGCCNV